MSDPRPKSDAAKANLTSPEANLTAAEGNLTTAEANCKGCTRPDHAEKMVACDKCNSWWHFDCVGVRDSINDRSWRCKNCSMFSISATSQRTNSSGIRLRLKQLEEAKALEDQQAQKDREYLAKKHQLELEAEALDGGSFGSGISGQNHAAIQNWVDDQNQNIPDRQDHEAVHAVPNMSTPLSTSTVTIAANMPIVSTAAITESNPIVMPHTLPENTRPFPQQNILPAMPNGPPCLSHTGHTVPQQPLAGIQNNSFPMQRAIMFPPRLQQPFQQSYCQQFQLQPHQSYSLPKLVPAPIRSSNPIQASLPVNFSAQVPAQQATHNHEMGHEQTGPGASSQFNNTAPPPQNQIPCPTASVFPETHSTWPCEAIINPQQLAARHVVAKDLPKFSGDPMEWPMFINSFQSTTVMCGIQPDENLARLQKCLVGSAREKVQSLLTMPMAIPEILRTLEEECGRPEFIIQRLLTKLRSDPQPDIRHLPTLITFGREVRNLVTYMEGANLHSHLSNPMLLSELIARLPPSLRLEWGMHAQRIPDVTLKAFSEYVSSIKSAACQVSTVVTSTQEDSRVRCRTKREKEGFVNAHSRDNHHPAEKKAESKSFPESQRQVTEVKPCIVCGRSDHKIRSCEKFLKFTLPERLKIVEQYKLCKRCLTGHGKWPCRTKQSCGIDGCEELHNKLLHSFRNKSAETTQTASTSAVVTAHCHMQTSCLFKIIPVTLHSEGKAVSTFAFLDDGSDLTLVEGALADELGLKGIEKPLCLQWTGNVTRKEASSRQVQFNISGEGNDKQYALRDVRTVECLSLPKQSLNYAELREQFPHLRGLPIQSYHDAVPRILIGVDNARLKLALNRRERGESEPVAIKSRLGWTIFGGRRKSLEAGNLMIHTCECSQDRELHELVKDYLEMENVGMNGPLVLESADDQRARRILQETTKRTATGRFETGLLWRTDSVTFPDSFPMAERRLKCLERKLQSDPDLRAAVTDQLVDYLDRGYAHKATARELQESDSGRVWYLPISVVRNPRKPNKIRLVWDAAASVQGISLNSMLLKGPDLLTPLISVLSRFRQRQIAIAGDLRQMFHQVSIRREDCQSQRFLWRDNSSCKPEIYIMDVATFGATCSPCSAQHVKNTNAMEFFGRYPEAASAIVNNTYVDDYLDSRDSVEEAAKIANEVRVIHNEAGFEIRNWQSNSKEVLSRVGEESCDAVKNFSAEKTTVAERILGIVWVPGDDMLVFLPQFRKDLQPLISSNTIPTKRQVLQVVMSFFDPLGIVSNYTIHGRVLIQSVWRSGIQWDDPLIDEDRALWRRWIDEMPKLSQVQISRCYFPGYEEGAYDSLQLHLFVDASELAYSSVVYFRIVDRGQARCALVASKAKVTRLKPQTIPRNELTAAVIGVRLMKSVAENHTVPIRKRFIWTDSMTVLSWIRADPRKYHQYVAFRVSELLSETEISEWRWVPSKLNIADEATKWGGGPNFSPNSAWFQGPNFLYLPEEEWPVKTIVSAVPKDELRSTFAHWEANAETLLDFASFSKLDDLLKKIAYLYHFLHRCRDKNRTKADCRTVLLSYADHAAAETSLWRMVQRQQFSDECAILEHNKNAPTAQRKRFNGNSSLAKLSIVLDDDELIRMESRIDPAAAYYSFDFRNPIILPRQNHVTKLLILRYHQRYAHANTETVLNELRQKFYISKLRSLVQKTIKACTWCRVYRAKPCEPRMAPLPQVRVAPFVRAFTFTGLDYFGPLIIKRGRSNIKRWVALFTCLSIRAVHLEVVHSLSAESCKMAIRRFVTRRGAPQQIFSDNGTNFRGVSRELAKEIAGINKSIAGTFTNADTEWHFNPPSAPHMGGVWERKVRSVKEALSTLSHPHRLDDEGLLTFLAEAEMIVNSHPLTFVPVKFPDLDVITPNCFLLMSSSGANNPARIPIDEVCDVGTNWKLMQILLNQFWRCWIKAYLPTIAKRSKWLDETRPMKVGDLVVVVDEAVRNGWLRGKVVKTFPGQDGRIRKVEVRTNAGLLVRPVIKVALLDVSEKDE